jgi:hypothetical protein
MEGVSKERQMGIWAQLKFGKGLSACSVCNSELEPLGEM